MAKKKKPKSYAVTPTSTYRKPGYHVKTKTSRGGTQVQYSKNTRFDLRKSSAIDRANIPSKAVVKKTPSAKQTFDRLAAKAGFKGQSIDPNIPVSSVAPDSTVSPPLPGVTDIDKESFFAPSAEEGARRRKAVFGTESKLVAGAAIVGAAAALIAAPWLAIKLAGSAGGTTAVSTAARVGTRGLAAKAATSSAGRFVANSATKAATLTWIQRLLTSTKTVTTTSAATGRAATRLVTTTASAKAIGTGAAAGLLVGSIGSYPFAGFIEEEALQTLGFGINSAKQNNDWEGADEAIVLQEEILNPSLWSQIKSAIPFVNILDKLDKFREAAVIKVAIDKRHVRDLRIQAETGESDNAMYARIRAEREESDKQKKLDDEAYYANIEAQRVAARAAERKEEERYWEKILGNREKEEKIYVSNNGDYWEGYYRALAENKKETPSKLNFGLL